MKRRVLSLLLTLCLIVGLLPAVAIPHAHAEEAEATPEPGGALETAYTLQMAATGSSLTSLKLELTNYDTPVYTKNTTLSGTFVKDGTSYTADYIAQNKATEDDWNAKLIWHTGDEGPTLYLDGFVTDTYNEDLAVFRYRTSSVQHYHAAILTGDTAPLKIVLQGENSDIQCMGGIHYRNQLTIESVGDTTLSMYVGRGGIMPRSAISAQNTSSAGSAVDAGNLILQANLTIQNTSGGLNTGGIVTSNRANIIINDGNITLKAPSTGTYALRTLNSGDIIINGGNVTADGGYRGIRTATSAYRVYIYGGSTYINGSYSAVYAGGDAESNKSYPIVAEDACCTIYASAKKTAVATSRVAADIWFEFHRPTEHPATEPDVGVEGNTLYYSCSKCNKYFSDKWGTKEIEKDSWIIPAIAAHVCEENAEIIPGKEASCTEDGLTEGKKCSVCDEILVPQDVIPGGHSWKDASCTASKTCEVCGATEGEALAHNPAPAVKENKTETAYELAVYCADCGTEISRQTVKLYKGTVTLWGTAVTVDNDEDTEIPDAYYWVNGENGGIPVAATAEDAWNYAFTIVDGIPTVTIKNAEYRYEKSFLYGKYDGKLKFIYEGTNNIVVPYDSTKDADRYFLSFSAATNEKSDNRRLYIVGAEDAVLNVTGGDNSSSMLAVSNKVYVTISGGTINLTKTNPGGVNTVFGAAYSTVTIENCNFHVKQVDGIDGKHPAVTLGGTGSLTINNSNVTIENNGHIGLCIGVFQSNMEGVLYAGTLNITGNSYVKIINNSNNLSKDYSGMGIYAATVNVKGGTLEVEARVKAVRVTPTLTNYGYYNMYTEKGGEPVNAYTQTTYFKVEAADEATHTHIHKITKENEVGATCTADGSYLEIITCTQCKAEVSRQTVTVPATGHAYDNDEDLTCNNCGEEREPLCDHANTTTAEEIIADATCESAGSKKVIVTCECGEVISETVEEIKALGHTEKTNVETVDATCTTAGFVKTTVICEVCGETISETVEEIKALGHTEKTDVETKAATCTEAGYTKTTVTCTVCGETISETVEEIKALGHTEKTNVETVDATCTTAGSVKTTVICEVCGETISETTEEIKALGHTEKTDVETKAATCTEAGYTKTTVTCTVCGEKISETTEEIKALGHTEAEAVVENFVDSDLNNKGSYDSVVYCSVCNAELKRETIVIDEKTGATAEVNGKKYYTLLEAWQNATANSTIKLLDDVDLTGLEGMYVPATTLTLDLNQKTLYVPFQALAFAGNGFTIKNGTIDSKGASYGLWIGGFAADAAAANVTIEDVTVNGGINIKNATGVTLKDVTVNAIDYYAVWAEYNAYGVVIESGTYNGAAAAVNAVDADAVTVKGGKFNTNVSAYCEEGFHAADTDGDGYFTIGAHEEETIPAKDATCTETGLTAGKKCSICGEILTAQEEIKALGHTEAEAVVENFVDSDLNNKGSYDSVVYCSVCNAELSRETNEIPVKEGAVAEVNGIKYATLADAIAADGEIKLIADVTAQGMVIALGETIDLNGYTLTADILATIKMNGGTFKTSKYTMVGEDGLYKSADAIFTVSGEKLNVTIHSGTMILNQAKWYTGEGQTLKIEKNATFVIPEGSELYVNGSKVIVEGTAANLGILTLANGAHLKGDIAGTIQMAGGTFETSKYVMIGATEGKYTSTDAKFTITPNETLDMVIHSGTITLNEELWYTGKGQTLKIEKDATFVIPEGKTLYVNGSKVIVEGTAANFGTLILADGAHLKGDIAGTIQMAGGTFETSKYVMIGATEGKYLSSDAKFTIIPNATMDMTVISGTITLNDANWWTLAGQTLTIAEDAKFVVPAGKNINVQGTVIVDGTAVIDGTVTLYNKTATVKAAEGLKVITNAGDKVWYTEGKYIVHDHTEEDLAAKNATCTETGLTAGKKCSVCGDILVAQEEIKALGHTEKTDVETKAATCTEAGYTKTTVTCTVCGETISETTEEIKALGHTEKTDVETKDATCTEAGYTKTTVTCTVCGETISETTEEIKALGHTEETIPGKDASCTETGLTEGKKCSVCGEVLVAQEETPAKGHTEEAISGKDATCNETGLTEGKKCSVCGEITVAQEEIAALGHTYDNDFDATCNVCGEIRVVEDGLTVTADNKLQLVDSNANHIYHRVTVYFLGDQTVSDITNEAALKAIDPNAETFWGFAQINGKELKESGKYVLVLNYNNGVGSKKESVFVEADVVVSELVLPTVDVDVNKIVATPGSDEIINYRAVVYYLGNRTVTDITNEAALKALDPTAKTSWGLSEINKIQLWKSGNYVVHLQYNIGKSVKYIVAKEFTVAFDGLTLDVVGNQLVAADPDNTYLHHRAVVYYVGDELVNPENEAEVKAAAITETTYWGLNSINNAKLTQSGNYVVMLHYNLANSPKLTIAIAVTI